MRDAFAVAAAVPQLATIPPGRLVDAPYVSALQLTNPDDPQAVLTSLRTAAAAEGPLLVYVAGQLVLDSRQHLLHLALGRTTARTARYTALPWHWLAAELRQRPPGATTVVVDLAADAEVWQALQPAQHEQALGGPYALYGVVQLHDRRHRSVPAYTHALARILRADGPRPTEAQLHFQAVRDAALDAATALWLAPPAGPAATAPAARPAPPLPPQPINPPAPTGTTPPPRPPSAIAEGDPHHAITQASRAGRHAEAAAIAATCEQAALRRHGPNSSEVAHWIEVRAVVALEEGAPERACELWLRAAVIRLAAGQPETHPDVATAVDHAHYAWHHVTEAHKARELGTELLTVRTQVTGKSGAREDVQRRLDRLGQVLQT